MEVAGSFDPTGEGVQLRSRAASDNSDDGKKDTDKEKKKKRQSLSWQEFKDAAAAQFKNLKDDQADQAVLAVENCENCDVSFGPPSGSASKDKEKRSVCCKCASVCCTTCVYKRPPLVALGYNKKLPLCNNCYLFIEREVDGHMEDILVAETLQRKWLQRTWDMGFKEFEARKDIYIAEVVTTHALLQFEAQQRGGLQQGFLSSHGAADILPADTPDGPVNAFGFHGRGTCCEDSSQVKSVELENFFSVWNEITDRDRYGIILRGIPNSHRAKLWRIAANLDTILQNHANVYYSLVHTTDLSRANPTIQIDIARTLTNHEMFCGTNAEGVQKLFRLLTAYSLRYRPDLGYSQGMSYLAATLLIYFPNEEEAFWMFVLIFEKFGMEKLYSDSFGGLMALCDSVAQSLPKPVIEHLDAENLKVATYASQWFLTLFTRSFQCWASIMLIWDLLIVAPASAFLLLRIGAAVHQPFKDLILDTPDTPGLMNLFQNILPHKHIHIDMMRKALTVRVLTQPMPQNLPIFELTKPVSTSAPSAASSLSSSWKSLKSLGGKAMQEFQNRTKSSSDKGAAGNSEGSWSIINNSSLNSAGSFSSNSPQSPQPSFDQLPKTDGSDISGRISPTMKQAKTTIMNALNQLTSD
eukprot:TRINITY_DN67604_c5_g2_i1.p1 TRINITY_DN67604_c5_g2~~TRINITY_DN67604_c5_g2_i1.p1  ORF type:complete len:713 (-),score=49.73 TRINITY_DN67604_c5_g2_i1:116-2032(-)